jgi:hypothetical protein
MKTFLTLLALVVSPTAWAASPVPADGNIAAPGDWYLAANFSTNGGTIALQIKVDKVNLDLNGKIIQCSPTSPKTPVTVGIHAANRANITIPQWQS